MPRSDAVDALAAACRGPGAGFAVPRRRGAGTTNTGTVDDLDALADFGSGPRLHADAAYGGFFALTERGRAASASGSRPHCQEELHAVRSGCLLVKDPARCGASHSVRSYMRHAEDRLIGCGSLGALSQLPRPRPGSRSSSAARGDRTRSAARLALEASRRCAIPGMTIIGRPQLSSCVSARAGGRVPAERSTSRALMGQVGAAGVLSCALGVVCVTSASGAHG